jgi:ElaB/YqjD/DUF883 family membrane-anchored ribosome-binding protein
MEKMTTPPRSLSLFALLRALTGNTRTFIRQEVQLAKTEISEKASRMGKNATALAVGGAIAYAGAIVLLVGLGWLAGYGLREAGLNPLLANSLGVIAVGILIAVLGSVVLFKGLNTLKRETLKPERTIQTLQELKGEGVSSGSAGADKPSSREMQSRVEATEERLGETLDALGYKLDPQRINQEVRQKIQAQPYKSGLIAMGAGLVGGLLLTRKRRR